MTASPALLERLVGSRLLRDGSAVGLGMAAASLATLIGMRLLTELVAPALFGGLALANGIITLMLGILVQPLAQAAFRFWPDHESEGTTGALIRLLNRAIARRLLLAGGLVLAAIIADRLWLGWLSPTAWGLVLATFAIDALRTRQTTLLNASGRLKGFALLIALDALARPAGAAALVVFAGASLEALLAGQALGAGLVLAGFLVHAQRQRSFPASNLPPSGAELTPIARFSLPLAGIALVAWATGMADRYIVGGLLGLAAAGTYAAAYALGSRPLLLVGQVTDATLRQRLYAAHSAGDSQAMRRTLQRWLLTNLGAGLSFALLLALAADLVVRLLLGPAYRLEAAALLPWIAVGSALYLGAQAIERILYAERRTRLVLLLQAATAAIGIAAAAAGAYLAGARGVAIAVPVTFGAQLLMTMMASRHMFRQDPGKS